MRCAKTLTIVEIKWLTTIAQLDDVVGVHTVLGLCPAAPVPVIDRLAPVPCTLDDAGAPGLELGRAVDRIDLSSLQPGRAGIPHPHQGRQGTQPSHGQPSCAAGAATAAAYNRNDPAGHDGAWSPLHSLFPRAYAFLIESNVGHVLHVPGGVFDHASSCP
jgi:hypothetical protein